MDVKQHKDAMRAYFENQEYDQVLRCAKEILLIEPDDWDAILLKATVLSLPLPEFCDYAAALDLVNSALEKDRADAQRWVGLAQIQEACGKYLESGESYRKAIECDPSNYDAIVGISILAGMTDVKIQPTEIRRLLMLAINRNPNRWCAYAYLARILVSEGKIEEAIQAYHDALSRIPSRHTEMRDSLKKEVAELT